MVNLASETKLFICNFLVLVDTLTFYFYNNKASVLFVGQYGETVLIQHLKCYLTHWGVETGFFLFCGIGV
jgi:hypothetical protein